MASLLAGVGQLSQLAKLWWQVKFVLNDKTTLSDLLSLNLHKFEDEVKNIVDKAVKEMSMEKMLKELNTTWTTMEFEHVKHPRTGITMLQTSEELIETLEDNQVHTSLLWLCVITGTGRRVIKFSESTPVCSTCDSLNNKYSLLYL